MASAAEQESFYAHFGVPHPKRVMEMAKMRREVQIMDADDDQEGIKS